MKRSIFYFIFLLSGIITHAQHPIEYAYDVHGNRIGRHVVEIRLDTLDFKKDSTAVITETLYTEKKTRLEVTNVLDETIISMYPNPTNDILNIDILNSNATERTIYIYSITGQIIEKKNETENSLKIDLSNFSQGTYIIIIQSGSYKYQQKIIKQ
ncbi:MAG: T9SS type A sorting domain-containing protein [Bacteroidales bacterium]|nr:T9SS type A sorting domain-containing protein [Bacteroidales bacterium]